MEKKDTLSSCSESEEQQMQLIQDKSKESCMVSFQRLHSHLKRLSNNDLKGSRTENGFGRAFATLFGQDFETFTGTMFLNMDQLQKQLDNNEFQEIGSMASFKVLETQFLVVHSSQRFNLIDEYIVMERNTLSYNTLQFIFQNSRETTVQFMEYVKKSIDERALHKREHDSRKDLKVGLRKRRYLIEPRTSRIFEMLNHHNDVDHNSSDLRPNDRCCLVKIKMIRPRSHVHSTCETTRSSLVHHQMTSVHISSGPVLHQMTFERNSLGLVPQYQMTSAHNRSELGIHDHSNELFKFKAGSKSCSSSSS
ncbi:hypothetical protein Tco_0927837 [Tanacetum coccineum]